VVENGRLRQKTADCGRKRQIGVENGYSRRYGRRRAHVIEGSRDLKIVYNSEQRCRYSSFLSLALNPRL